ncbi:putative nucleic acid-binding Zn-ribbon protein [Mycobacterium frederiksbergense]|uniref:Nucleic acid-binding Zn-ribbon protein n=1 Tax=Mycolicibacterium frederiksbergense TaxID=117567 RepID=A0ABT6KWC7_9MYCO|nr:C4-type zinc ribbon domain-containing protein [Mycolicibacterium frederiksbergense]MDH6194991.1 putative nucleic acid-binding Zn-ribbon protein [Mycolicibacterium frederiksbergense]
MKAEVRQQRSLLALTEVDAELGRIEHRAKHLAEQQQVDEAQGKHATANDGVAVLGIALEDLDTQVAKLEAEIDSVRQREDRDRALIDGGSVGAKQVAEIQHELETLERRQSSLEDSLLEIMERREELSRQQAEALQRIDDLQTALSAAQQARDAALAEIDQSRHQANTRRDGLVNVIDAELVELYERQRARGGAGAGLLQGRRCGACRIEIDRGESARIAAAAEDDVLRCPECGAILLRIKQ